MEVAKTATAAVAAAADRSDYSSHYSSWLGSEWTDWTGSESAAGVGSESSVTRPAKTAPSEPTGRETPPASLVCLACFLSRPCCLPSLFACRILPIWARDFDGKCHCCCYFPNGTCWTWSGHDSEGQCHFWTCRLLAPICWWMCRSELGRRCRRFCPGQWSRASGLCGPWAVCTRCWDVWLTRGREASLRCFVWLCSPSLRERFINWFKGRLSIVLRKYFCSCCCIQTTNRILGNFK